MTTPTTARDTVRRALTRRIAAAAAAAGLALAACSPEREPAPVADRPGALGPDGVGTQLIQPASRTLLSAAELDSLQRLYPVLRETSAPAPQPAANATPTAVPPRVKESLPQRVLRTVRGEATYYADAFEGRRTASGIPFRQNQLVAAHRGFPFGTVLRVTNERNDRSVVVRVVDRGPWGAKAEARNTIIDLSKRAARQIGYTAAGRAPVKVEVLEWGPGLRRA